ncbi:MAG: hypothetical protein VKO65_04975 [Cyanobacteriota bacterium]|nr:hypothetical protein [Cyanobacteriota bacterium]
MIGLYDHQGILRFAGPSSSDCLAYAELFGLAADSFTLESVEKIGVQESTAASLSAPSRSGLRR